jgi:hypothetical protein
VTIPVFDEGDLVRLGNPSSNTDTDPFRDIAGTATNPTAVALTVLRPDGTDFVLGWPVAGVNGNLINETTGRFYGDYAVQAGETGLFAWRFSGTGEVETSEAGLFYVRWRPL